MRSENCLDVSICFAGEFVKVIPGFLRGVFERFQLFLSGAQTLAQDAQLLFLSKQIVGPAFEIVSLNEFHSWRKRSSFRR